MKTEDLHIHQANDPTPLFIAAGASLLAGTLTYVLARPVAPALMIEGLSRFPAGALQNSIFLPFSRQLPSFFHMLAMLLATLAVTVKRPRLRTSALAVSVALGLAMEFVQHPAVLNSVSTCIKTPFCSWLPGLERYSHNGTFDPFDLAAIISAALVTWLYFHQSSLFRNSNRHHKDPTP